MRSPPVALRKFLEPYDPTVARLFFAARRTVLAAAPQATELVYDAYNAVTAVYTFTDRLNEAFCHVAAYPGHVNLGFNRGAALAASEQLLVGTGTTIRHVRISATGDLQQPGVQRLVRAGVEKGKRRSCGHPTGPKSRVKAVNPRK